MKLEDFKKLKKGDKVKVVTGGGLYGHNFNVGEVVRVLGYFDNDPDFPSIRAERESSNRVNLEQDIHFTDVEYIDEKSVKVIKSFQLWGVAEKINKKWIPRQNVIYSTRKEARKNSATLKKLFQHSSRNFKVIKVHIDTKEKA